MVVNETEIREFVHKNNAYVIRNTPILFPLGNTPRVNLQKLLFEKGALPRDEKQKYTIIFIPEGT